MSMWGKNEGKPDSTPQQYPVAASHPVAPRPPAAPAPVSPVVPAAASMGRSTRLRGDVYSEEELYLDGEMEGTLEVRNRLTIGPNGKVKATVKAKEIVVRGSVQGNVEASDRISIMNGASIVGDVKTAGIVIEDGAYFKGGIDILRPEAVKKQVETPAPAAPKMQSVGSA